MGGGEVGKREAKANVVPDPFSLLSGPPRNKLFSSTSTLQVLCVLSEYMDPRLMGQSL